jgi:hypothetical protein
VASKKRARAHDAKGEIARGEHAPLTDREREKLRDLTAFMRDALAALERYEDPFSSGEFASRELAESYMAIPCIEQGRLNLQRTLLKWEPRAPYHVLRADLRGNRRPAKLAPGAYAEMQGKGWRPSLDATIEMAVGCCARLLGDANDTEAFKDFAHAMRALATRGIDTPGPVRDAANSNEWNAFLASKVPRSQKGQRLGRQSAIKAVAGLIGVSADTVDRACKRANERRLTPEGITAKIETLMADVRAGIRDLPHPR